MAESFVVAYALTRAVQFLVESLDFTGLRNLSFARGYYTRFVVKVQRLRHYSSRIVPEVM